MIRSYQHVCCLLLGMLCVIVVVAQKEYYLLFVLLACIPYDKLPRYVMQCYGEYLKWKQEERERDEFSGLEMGLTGRRK